MRKSPLFTLALVLSLALGIGANSAIFSLVDAALLESLPVPNPKQLHRIEWLNQGFPEELCNMMTGNSEGDNHRFQGSSIAANTYRQLAQQQHGFAALIGFFGSSKAAVVVNKLAAEQFQLQFVSANFFSGIGVLLQLGRPFSLSDDRVGQPPLVILSDRFWRKQFGARREVLGQVLRVNDVSVEIAGVARPRLFGLQIGEWVDLYAPLATQVALSPSAKLDRDFSETDRLWWVHMIGRVKPEVPASQAIEELSTLFRRVVVPSGVHVKAEKIPRLIALPGQHGIDPLGVDDARALWILFLLVSLILLIVCANVANLLLASSCSPARVERMSRTRSASPPVISAVLYRELGVDPGGRLCRPLAQLRACAGLSLTHSHQHGYRWFRSPRESACTRFHLRHIAPYGLAVWNCPSLDAGTRKLA